MFYVYRFLDKKKNIIYVGKSKQDLEQRFRGHLHLPDACYDLTYKIEYIECATESDMSIKEIYYINKYRHDGDFFNVLDMADVPVSVEFNDKWKQYKGSLGAHFHHSINYIKGYTTEKEERYNKDGTIDRRKSNAKKGVSQFVEGFTEHEVDLIIDHFIDELNGSENKNQEEIRFRNLVLFVLGVNLPHKINDLLCLKYSDLFDKNNNLKTVGLKLGRWHKDEIIEIPLMNVAKKIVLAYTEYLGWNYNANANDPLFQTREHQIVSPNTWWRILNDAVDATGIKKNIGSESLRKTYGINLYTRAEDKLDALNFLGELWGSERESKVIKYLNLTDNEVDFEYFLSEYFSLGDVDLSRIKCLQPRPTISAASKLSKKRENTGKLSQESKQKSNGRKWTREELEVIEKHLKQNIPIEVLAEEYKLHKSVIKFWISTYESKREDSVDIDKGAAELKKVEPPQLKEYK